MLICNIIQPVKVLSCWPTFQYNTQYYMINNITWLNVRLPEEINFWIGTRYPNGEEKLVRLASFYLPTCL